jgi:hypothetical protein
MAVHIAEDVCAAVPHRQVVFTIPKRFRLFFRFHRPLLGDLARLAWRTVLEVHRAVLGREDVVPGAVVAIQTFGQLIHWHPHIHALVTDGAFTPDGTFIPLPAIEDEPFVRSFQERIFALLLAKGRITDATVSQMRSWRHSGFSVDRSVRLAAGDAAGLERLARYLIRCPFSLARMIRFTEQGQVLYRAGNADCHRFPDPARCGRGADDPSVETSRNFQLFDPLDLIAEITQHIPEPRKHLVRYAGWYSNRSRGLRAAARAERSGPVDEDRGGIAGGGSGDEIVIIDESLTPGRAESRRRWAQLIQRVFEVDPLSCPRCGGAMRVLGFIESYQAEIIERILRHLGLWHRPAPRGPPLPESREALVRELRYVPDAEHLPDVLDTVEDPDGAGDDEVAQFDLHREA